MGVEKEKGRSLLHRPDSPKPNLHLPAGSLLMMHYITNTRAKNRE